MSDELKPKSYEERKIEYFTELYEYGRKFIIELKDDNDTLRKQLDVAKEALSEISRRYEQDKHGYSGLIADHALAEIEMIK